MELTVAELTIEDLSKRLKELTDTSKPGPDAALLARTGVIAKRLRWGQTTVSNLAMGLTSPQALKAGMAAKGDHRTAWQMDDKVTKTAAQMLKADHAAKATAEKAAFSSRRGRPQRRGDGRRPYGGNRKRDDRESAWGEGQSTSAKKRRKRREQAAGGGRNGGGRQEKDRRQPVITGNKHKDKICDLCNKKGHIKFSCPKKAELMPAWEAARALKKKN